MKDLAAILFVAVVFAIAIYMIWKEQTDEEYFDQKHERKVKRGRILKAGKQTFAYRIKMVANKRKRIDDNKGLGGK